MLHRPRNNFQRNVDHPQPMSNTPHAPHHIRNAPPQPVPPPPPPPEKPLVPRHVHRHPPRHRRRSVLPPCDYSYNPAGVELILNHINWDTQPIYRCCRYCLEHNRPMAAVYNHFMYTVDGRPVCPVLRSVGCSRCGDVGDAAHTEADCCKRQLRPMNPMPLEMQPIYSMPPPPPPPTPLMHQVPIQMPFEGTYSMVPNFLPPPVMAMPPPVYGPPTRYHAPPPPPPDRRHFQQLRQQHQNMLPFGNWTGPPPPMRPVPQRRARLPQVETAKPPPPPQKEVPIGSNAESIWKFPEDPLAQEEQLGRSVKPNTWSSPLVPSAPQPPPVPAAIPIASAQVSSTPKRWNSVGNKPPRRIAMGKNGGDDLMGMKPKPHWGRRPGKENLRPEFGMQQPPRAPPPSPSTSGNRRQHYPARQQFAGRRGTARAEDDGDGTWTSKPHDTLVFENTRMKKRRGKSVNDLTMGDFMVDLI